jgi:hypothetical protein
VYAGAVQAAEEAFVQLRMGAGAGGARLRGSPWAGHRGPAPEGLSALGLVRVQRPPRMRQGIRMPVVRGAGSPVWAGLRHRPFSASVSGSGAGAWRVPAMGSCDGAVTFRLICDLHLIVVPGWEYNSHRARRGGGVGLGEPDSPHFRARTFGRPFGPGGVQQPPATLARTARHFLRADGASGSASGPGAVPAVAVPRARGALRRKHSCSPLFSSGAAVRLPAVPRRVSDLSSFLEQTWASVQGGARSNPPVEARLPS